MVKKPTKKSTKKPTKKTPKKPMKKTSKKSIKKTAKKPMKTVKKPAKKILIEVIYIYKSNDAQIARITVSNTISEVNLMKRMLKGMTSKEVKNLVKLSTMQICDEKDAIKYLLQRNGKYYFDTIANDPDVTKWASWKKTYEKSI